MNFPILSTLTFLPLVGSIFILLIKDSSEKTINNTKYVAIFTSFANFFLSIFLWFSFDPATADFQFVENKQWMRGYFNFKLGIDGISILFILLTTFIMPICVLSVINSVKVRIKEFLVAILVMETLMIGKFI